MAHLVDPRREQGQRIERVAPERDPVRGDEQRGSGDQDRAARPHARRAGSSAPSPPRSSREKLCGKWRWTYANACWISSRSISCGTSMFWSCGSGLMPRRTTSVSRSTWRRLTNSACAMPRNSSSYAGSNAAMETARYLPRFATGDLEAPTSPTNRAFGTIV